MAGEKPEIRADIELRVQGAFAEHQHRRGGQTRVARAEHVAACAGEELFVIER